jgi:hypothetical protein
MSEKTNRYVSQIEELRSSTSLGNEFGHISDKVYLDYAANPIYMTSLIKDYHDKLTMPSNQSQTDQYLNSFFTNPHSHNLSGLFFNREYIFEINFEALKCVSKFFFKDFDLI